MNWKDLKECLEKSIEHISDPYIRETIVLIKKTLERLKGEDPKAFITFMRTWTELARESLKI